MVSLEFFIDIILSAALWRWGRLTLQHKWAVAFPWIFGVGGGGVQKIQLRTESRKNGDLGGCNPLVRGSIQVANEWTPYSDLVVTDVYSTEQGIRLSFVKTSYFGGGGELNPPNPPSVRHCEYQEFTLGRCLGLTTLPPSCADCFKIWEPQLPGTLRACQGL
jgi:hypothetical protein